MSQRTSRLLLAVPVVGLFAALAIGPISSIAASLKDDVMADLDLDERVHQARDAMNDAVHERASQLAERTDRSLPHTQRPAPAQTEAMQRRRPPRGVQGTRPMPRTGQLPSRQLGDQTIPDFVALQDDAQDVRTHSGRVPPRG